MDFGPLEMRYVRPRIHSSQRSNVFGERPDARFDEKRALGRLEEWDTWGRFIDVDVF